MSKHQSTKTEKLLKSIPSKTVHRDLFRSIRSIRLIRNLKFLSLLYLFTSLLFFAPSVQAQSLELSITPPLVRANIKPGKTITQAFNIGYSGARPKNFVAKIVAFKSDDKTGIPVLLWQAKPLWLSYFSLANSNITLDKPFTLIPGQKDQLVVSLKIPENQRETEIYASIIFLSEESQSLENSQAVGGIGANMIVSITNTYPPKSEVSLKTFEPKTKPIIHIKDYYIFDNLNPIIFTAKAENSGSHAGLISGNFTVLAGKALSQQPLESGHILADSQRTLLASGGAELKLDPHLSNIGMATATINLETESSKNSGTFKIILIPAKAGLAALIAALLVFIFLKKSRGQKSATRS